VSVSEIPNRADHLVQPLKITDFGLACQRIPRTTTDEGGSVGVKHPVYHTGKNSRGATIEQGWT